MKVFHHHIYEYTKGIRKLILHTTRRENQPAVEKALRSKEIAHLIFPVGDHKINVFFGDASCISVIKKFNKQHLNDFNSEQDFILGVMLGYDTAMQCERYLKRSKRGALLKGLAA